VILYRGSDLLTNAYGGLMESSIEVDYLIVGAGAVGMAFADSLVTESDATIAIVDRRDQPGGHWNDAYPFVRLHQPSLNYGLNSRPLGIGAKDTAGLNTGYHELASGQEVLSHFGLAMHRDFLPTGRVRFFPVCEVGDDRTITSLLSGQQCTVSATTIVDATYSQMAIPSTHVPGFEIDPGLACVPVNNLPRHAADYSEFVIIGAGKTGIDAIVWLLINGADPSSIRWVVPRDSWLLDRANTQLAEEFFPRVAQSLADQVQCLAQADSIDDLFLRLEAVGEVRRIDPNITPTAYHCAIVSDGELEQLRRVNNVIRLGRVEKLASDQIVLEQGTLPVNNDTLFVDCSAAGIPTRPSVAVFDGDRITPQWVRLCQPTFSAAFVGHVEAAYDTDEEKNRLCTPIVPPTVPRHWVEMMGVELNNRQIWSADPELAGWMTNARLDGFTKLIGERFGVDAEVTEHLGHYLESIGAAIEATARLLMTD
jgi:hypothetical protein